MTTAAERLVRAGAPRGVAKARKAAVRQDDPLERAYQQGVRDGLANRHYVGHWYSRPGMWEAWLRGWRKGQKGR